ncbi:hypothetical protein B0H15DRAFT_866513 [Mycena belliarum]|uniref:Uncharacterized protein n=1 Tax=Mycena belliarum TaxID=1033014 RepID=A0AAD6XJJ0_9AGAR|nr:hypothetical protein B0H15DRAFT_866513 [Mycena belliae]
MRAGTRGRHEGRRHVHVCIDVRAGQRGRGRQVPFHRIGGAAERERVVRFWRRLWDGLRGRGGRRLGGGGGDGDGDWRGRGHRRSLGDRDSARLLDHRRARRYAGHRERRRRRRHGCSGACARPCLRRVRGRCGNGDVGSVCSSRGHGRRRSLVCHRLVCIVRHKSLPLLRVRHQACGTAGIGVGVGRCGRVGGVWGGRCARFSRGLYVLHGGGGWHSARCRFWLLRGVIGARHGRRVLS